MRAADDLTELLAADLETFVQSQQRRLEPLGPDLDAFLEAARASVAGGKRLRAAYCHAGWVAAGGTVDEPAVVWAAAALEWLHASALVHDDVMDASDVRRGRPAAHRGFEQLHRRNLWSGNPEQFGVGGAILLGDLLLGWCDEMFRTSRLGPDALVRATPYLDACKTEVVCGQFLDLVGQARGTNSVEDAMRVVVYKSAKYTVERPLHLGAALAGASVELIAALTAYGIPLGEAFQLRDDVLGVFGDPGVTGKPAGDDLREGKRTVLVAYCAEGADQAGRQLLERLGDPDLDESTVDRLRDLIVSTGALERVEATIERLEATAAATLEAAPVLEPAQALLRSLATRTTRRAS